MYVVIASLTVGCSLVSPRPPQVAVGEPFELALGQRVSLEQTDLQIEFAAVEDESRCPQGVVCLWQGNARVAISVSGTGFSLNTSIEPRRATFEGYSIQLLAVNPYPRFGEDRQFGDYVITLLVNPQ